MGQSGGPWAQDIPVTTFPASESLSLCCPILTCSHITGCETLTVLAFDVCFWYSLGKIQNGGKLYFPLIEKEFLWSGLLNIRPHGPCYGVGLQGRLRSPEPTAWNYSIKLFKRCKAETVKSFFFFKSSWCLFQEHTVFPKDSCSLVKLVYGSNPARSVTVRLWCPDKSLRVERRRDGRRSRLFKGDRRSAAATLTVLTVLLLFPSWARPRPSSVVHTVWTCELVLSRCLLSLRPKLKSGSPSLKQRSEMTSWQGCPLTEGACCHPSCRKPTASSRKAAWSLLHQSFNYRSHLHVLILRLEPHMEDHRFKAVCTRIT